VELVDVVRVLGFVVAIAGAALTARVSPRETATKWRTWVINAGRWVRRHVPGHHRDAIIRPTSIGTASAVGNATVTAEALVWAPDGPVSVQIDLLRKRTESLAAQIRDLRADHGRQIAGLRAELATGLAERRDELLRLRAEHKAAQDRADQFDKRGLPLIIVGVLLTSWPDRWITTWTEVILLVIAGIASAASVVVYVADRPR